MGAMLADIDRRMGAGVTKAINLEMFLDVSCPWCHGALETNRRLLDELAADPDVPPLRVIWRFMRLHPMPREGGLPIEEYYRSWGDDSDAAVERARSEVREYVRSVGVRVDEARYTYLHDPLTSHRLLAAVRDDGGDDLPSLWGLARAIFTANFVHGVDITDLAALRGAVERSGLRLPVRIWEAVEDGGHMDAPLADHARALEIGLDGVPRMHVGGQIVPTWIDPDEVRSRLRAAIAAAT
jgi:predicted DsbA family dithiol-disulfide isomerase